MSTIKFQYAGVNLTYHPKSNEFGHYFETENKNQGFYTKDLIPYWGRPTKKTFLNVCKSYVESSPGRLKVLKTYANLKN